MRAWWHGPIVEQRRLDGPQLRTDLQTGFVGQAGPKVVELSEGFDPTPQCPQRQESASYDPLTEGPVREDGVARGENRVGIADRQQTFEPQLFGLFAQAVKFDGRRTDGVNVSEVTKRRSSEQTESSLQVGNPDRRNFRIVSSLFDELFEFDRVTGIVGDLQAIPVPALVNAPGGKKARSREILLSAAFVAAGGGLPSQRVSTIRSTLTTEFRRAGRVLHVIVAAETVRRAQLTVNRIAGFTYRRAEWRQVR